MARPPAGDRPARKTPNDPAKATSHTIPGGPKKLALQATAEHARAQQVTTGETVTIACKLPNGLNLGHIHGDDKPHVILRGSNHPLAVGGVLGLGTGYGLTHGIDARAWAEWKKDHDFLPAIQNGLIFEHERGDHARGMAIEMAPEIRSGLEPIDSTNPGADDRVADDVEQTDEQKKLTAKAKAEQEERLDEYKHTSGDQ